MSWTSPQNLLHVPPTNPRRRMTGRLFWLVIVVRASWNQREVLAHALTSLTFLTFPDLWCSTLLPESILSSGLLSHSAVVVQQ